MKLMNTKQRKALQAVVLEAGELQTGPDYLCYSCLALEAAWRMAHPWPASTYRERTLGGRKLSTAYWEDFLGGAPDEDFVTRTGEITDAGVQEARLLALALLHTLIGSGDFEAITGYSPDNP